MDTAVARETRSQDGFTLVEVMVTVMIMSIAFVTILEGEAVFFHTTTIRHATASLDTAARNYATSLDNAPYAGCAASYASTPDSGTTASVALDYWTGSAAPASFTDRATCIANGDRGAQRLVITMTDTSSNQTDKLTIVKRKP